jgi:hypothetical protein
MKREVRIYLYKFAGFTKLIENGYDEKYDLYYLIIKKLDEDLN